MASKEGSVDEVGLGWRWPRDRRTEKRGGVRNERMGEEMGESECVGKTG